LKILQVISYYPPALSAGGPPQVMFDLARELVTRGHSVSVFTTDVRTLDDWSTRVEKYEEEMEGIRVRRFQRRSYSNKLPIKFLNLMPSGIEGKHLDEVKDYDIVHIADVTTPMTVKFAEQAHKLGIPYIISVFGNLSPFNGLVYPFLRLFFNIMWGNKVLSQAAALMVQTPHEEEACSGKISAEKIETMLLPVDMNQFRDLPKQGRFREKFGIGNDEKIILFLGRVHPYKGIDILVRAVAGVFKSYTGKCRLVIAGTDEGYRASLVREIKNIGIEDCVVFTGSIFGTEKLEAYTDATVFAITPTNYEETSLAALEACACGTPVIVTPRNDIPGLEEYQAGYRVDGLQELENALLTLLEKDELREKMGGNARRLISDRYALGRVTDRLEEVFLKIVKPK